MALMQGTFYAPSLNTEAHFTAFHPFDKQPRDRKEMPCLILLHGLMDGCTAWANNTTLLRMAADYGVLVFMPEGGRSFYADMASGGAYRHFLIEEVPSAIQEMFGLTLTRENTVIAGNSMGGYGALKAALTKPSLFGRCAALSPVIHPLDALNCIPSEYLIPGEELAIWGVPPSVPPKENLYHLASKSLPSKDLLSLYISIGQDDFLLGQNREFQEHLRRLDLPCTYVEAKGEHGWPYWEAHYREIFQHFFN